jgi:Zn ribbon nucleic-acid-binding protein
MYLVKQTKINEETVLKTICCPECNQAQWDEKSNNNDFTCLNCGHTEQIKEE